MSLPSSVTADFCVLPHATLVILESVKPTGASSFIGTVTLPPHRYVTGLGDLLARQGPPGGMYSSTAYECCSRCPVELIRVQVIGELVAGSSLQTIRERFSYSVCNCRGNGGHFVHSVYSTGMWYQNGHHLHDCKCSIHLQHYLPIMSVCGL